MKKILVAVKRVIDYNARIRVKPDKVCHGMVNQHHLDANMNSMHPVQTKMHHPCSLLVICQLHRPAERCGDDKCEDEHESLL